MEERLIFVETHGSIAPIECSECDGEAHVFRRAPYPFEGLEFRTFECLECGGQMERITPSETTSLVPT
jgi:NAD-dependent SIR2 family protein deacetylase